MMLMMIEVVLSTSPQRLIVDTDMGFDVDDAVALCLANRWSVYFKDKERLV